MKQTDQQSWCSFDSDVCDQPRCCCSTENILNPTTPSSHALTWTVLKKGKKKEEEKKMRHYSASNWQKLRKAVTWALHFWGSDERQDEKKAAEVNWHGKSSRTKKKGQMSALRLRQQGSTSMYVDWDYYVTLPDPSSLRSTCKSVVIVWMWDWETCRTLVTYLTDPTPSSQNMGIILVVMVLLQIGAWGGEVV